MRDVVQLMMKKMVFKLSVLLVLAGCAVPPKPATGPHPRGSLLIRVHANARYTVRDAIGCSESELRKILRPILSPILLVVLDVDQGTAFSDAWPTMDGAARAGYYHQCLVAGRAKTRFYVPTREGQHSTASPMFIPGFKDNTPPTGSDLIRMRDSQLLLHDVSMSLSRLAQHFGERPDKSQPVLVMPSGDTPMHQISKLLQAIVNKGNSNVCLVAAVKVEQENGGDVQ